MFQITKMRMCLATTESAEKKKNLKKHLLEFIIIEFIENVILSARRHMEFFVLLVGCHARQTHRWCMSAAILVNPTWLSKKRNTMVIN